MVSLDDLKAELDLEAKLSNISFTIDEPYSPRGRLRYGLFTEAAVQNFRRLLEYSFATSVKVQKVEYVTWQVILSPPVSVTVENLKAGVEAAFRIALEVDDLTTLPF